MAYVQIDPVTCEEVVECFLSKAIFSLLINEVGRRASREEKIRLVIGDVLDAVLASGTPVFRALRVHGRTLFVEIAADKRNHVLPRMIQEVVAGHSERDWICFDRGKLLRAMPQLRKEYPEPNISGDPWFRVMKNLDDLDFEKIFPEAVRPSDDNGESVMLGKGQYTDISFAWESDEHTSKRIAELETALAAKDAELEQARAEMSALREEVAALKKVNDSNTGVSPEELELALSALEEIRQGAASLEGHGLCSLVITMRREGKTEEEIAAYLSDAGKWCSAAQIGALLYCGNRVSKDAMQKHAQRLLGKA